MAAFQGTYGQDILLNIQKILLDFSIEATLAWELDGAIVYWNHGAERMYGYSSEEAIGRLYYDLLKPQYTKRRSCIKSILTEHGEYSGEIEQTCRNGSKLVVETRKQVVTIGSGQKIVIEANRDITERKRTEKELVQLNSKLSVALESVRAGIWEVDMVTGCYIWSPEMYELYGVDPSEPLYRDKGIANIYPEDRIIVEFTQSEAIKNHREFWDEEFRVENPKRGIVWVNGTGKIFYDKAGNPIKMIGVNIDITEQKLQQKLLLTEEKEKNLTLRKTIEMKDEFLSLISHEFKTPLTVINSALQAMELLCRDELSEKAKGFLEKIRQNSNRQMKLVNNLLDITRMNAGGMAINRKDTDIVLVTRQIAESIRFYAEQKGILLTFSAAMKRKIISIDEEHYERILLNLLSNSVKYTPEGKSIDIRIVQSKLEGRNWVSVAVSDEGIGIPEDKRDLIFERFGQVDTSLARQAEGTGIGLYLVKKLVRAMNGRITLQSTEGLGSTFTVLFPAVRIRPVKTQKAGREIRSDKQLMQASAIEFSDVYL